jgi:hypothetical protein
MLYLDLQVGLIAVFFFSVSTWLAMIQSCKIGCHVMWIFAFTQCRFSEADGPKWKYVWNNEKFDLHILSNWKNRISLPLTINLFIRVDSSSPLALLFHLLFGQPSSCGLWLKLSIPRTAVYRQFFSSENVLLNWKQSFVSIFYFRECGLSNQSITYKQIFVLKQI